MRCPWDYTRTGLHLQSLASPAVALPELARVVGTQPRPLRLDAWALGEAKVADICAGAQAGVDRSPHASGNFPETQRSGEPKVHGILTSVSVPSPSVTLRP